MKQIVEKTGPGVFVRMKWILVNDSKDLKEAQRIVTMRASLRTGKTAMEVYRCWCLRCHFSEYHLDFAFGLSHQHKP